MPALAHTKPTPEVVLAKALLRAAEQLGLSQSDLAEVLGVHRTTITQLKKPEARPKLQAGRTRLAAHSLGSSTVRSYRW